ncbi:MAG: hypothetical protein MZV64_25925 [Ignavibacteriales bacterium]|nr:hypothetical protein [Ignavibacteriales bacterium]
MRSVFTRKRRSPSGSSEGVAVARERGRERAGPTARRAPSAADAGVRDGARRDSATRNGVRRERGERAVRRHEPVEVAELERRADGARDRLRAAPGDRGVFRGQGHAPAGTQHHFAPEGMGRERKYATIRGSAARRPRTGLSLLHGDEWRHRSGGEVGSVNRTRSTREAAGCCGRWPRPRPRGRRTRASRWDAALAVRRRLGGDRHERGEARSYGLTICAERAARVHRGRARACATSARVAVYCAAVGRARRLPAARAARCSPSSARPETPRDLRGTRPLARRRHDASARCSPRIRCTTSAVAAGSAPVRPCTAPTSVHRDQPGPARPSAGRPPSCPSRSPPSSCTTSACSLSPSTTCSRRRARRKLMPALMSSTPEVGRSRTSAGSGRRPAAAAPGRGRGGRGARRSPRSGDPCPRSGS